MLSATMQSELFYVNTCVTTEEDGCTFANVTLMPRGFTVRQIFGLEPKEYRERTVERFWLDIPVRKAAVSFYHVPPYTVLTGDLAVLQNLLYALILIIIVIYNNAPALKGFRDKYNFKALVRKFHKRSSDPAHMKDDEAKWDVVPTKIDMDEILSVDLTPQDPNITWKQGGQK